MLRRVFADNDELDENRKRRQPRAQPPGAAHNPHGPATQRCAKSTTQDREWGGDKTQAAETVQAAPRQPGEPTASCLTAIVTQTAIASDKPGLTAVPADQAGLDPAAPIALSQVFTYVRGQSLKGAHDEGRARHGPAPAAPDRGKVFTAEAFPVNVAGRSAVSPARQNSTHGRRLEEAATGPVTFRNAGKQTRGGACPKRAESVGPTQPHRTRAVGEHHHFLRERRREMHAEAFHPDMPRRPAIEGTQSGLVRAHGLRHARDCGFASVRRPNYPIGAACNLRRLFRRLP